MSDLHEESVTIQSSDEGVNINNQFTLTNDNMNTDGEACDTKDEGLTDDSKEEGDTFMSDDQDENDTFIGDNKDKDHTAMNKDSFTHADIEKGDSFICDNNDEIDLSIDEIKTEASDELNESINDQEIASVSVYDANLWRQSFKEVKEKTKTKRDKKTDGRKRASGAGRPAKTYECKYCHFTCMGKDDMGTHYKKEHPKVKDKFFPCPEPNCDFSSNSRDNVYRHNSAAHKLRVFRCTFEGCDYESKYNSNLRHHTRQIHEKAEKKHKCEECSSCFALPSDLKWHKFIHHSDEKPFLCEDPNCNFKCKRPWELKEHKQRKHANTRPFKCGICDFRFKMVGDLKKHMDVHLGEKNIQCDLCHKKFICQKYLAKHKKNMHTENKDKIMFKCDKCNHMTKSKQNLQRHLEKHNPDHVMPFTCPECPRQFSNKSNMANHMTTHDPNRPYPCPMCEEYAANEIESLLSHIGVYHPGYENLYECGVCKRAYAKAPRLRQHYKSEIHQQLKAAHPTLKNEPDDVFKALMEKLYSGKEFKKVDKPKKYGWSQDLRGSIKALKNKTVQGTDGVKRKRGRPRKDPDQVTEKKERGRPKLKKNTDLDHDTQPDSADDDFKIEPADEDERTNDDVVEPYQILKRKRGRPRKNPDEVKRKKKRGRPKLNKRISDVSETQLNDRENDFEVVVKTEPIDDDYSTCHNHTNGSQALCNCGENAGAETSLSREKLLSDFVSNTDVGTLENVVVKIEKDDGEQEMYGFQ
ncbi:unnamed protein product, partial [Owenia fusiformis]